jgi:hypothetical protein
MKNKLNIGTWIYRLFLLSLIFGVLWVKGYLWWVFSIALLLYLWEMLVLPFLSVASQYSSRPSLPPRRPSPVPRPPAPAKQPSPAPPPQAQEQANAESPVAGEDDFREPRPSRSSPRRKGSGL